MVTNIAVDHLIATDDSDLHVMSMLRGHYLQAALVDHDAVPREPADRLAGPFAHVIVDEAQELTDAEWQMLLLRCPSRSFTVVGDRAQARHGFTESWQERLARVGLHDVELATLSWVYWHNHERLHGYLDDVPPAEFEETFYARARTDQPLVEIQ